MPELSRMAEAPVFRCILLTCGFSVALWAAMPSTAQAQDFTEEMQFEELIPCRGSASFCAPQLLARGAIDAGAAARLKAVLDQNHYATIAFDSPGGSVQAGLAIGMLVRERGVHTRVAPQYLEEVLSEDGHDSEMRIRAGDVACLSACAYAFMGGVSRTLEEGGRIGVHQFYGPGLENGQSTAQSMIAVLSQYMIMMGVDRELLDVASFTGSDEMAVLTTAEAIEYNLDNQHPLLASWQLVAMDKGETVVRVDQQQGGGDRVTSLAIARYEEETDVLAVIVRHGQFQVIDEEAVTLALAGLESKPTLCTAGYTTCVTLYPAQKWRYNVDTKSFTGVYLLDSDSLAKVVVATGTLHFNGDFPNAYYNIAPDVELGRVGLKNALLAIYR